MNAPIQPAEPQTAESQPAEAVEAPRVIRTAHEHGHFYSPVVDPEELLPHLARLWPQNPSVLGIDFNDAEHERILRDVFPKYLPDYDYPEHLEETDELDRFYTQNSQFSWLD